MDPLRKVLSSSFDDVLARIPEALKSEGFGVLTEIDVTATLKKKLDVDFRRYRILGACNPSFAHQALQGDLEIAYRACLNSRVASRIYLEIAQFEAASSEAWSTTSKFASLAPALSGSSHRPSRGWANELATK